MSRPNRRRAGFTLTELAIVLAMMSGLSAAIGHLYLETRAVGVQTEAQIALERRASLAFEFAARDLRGGALVEDEAGVTVQGAQGRIRYALEADRLVRTDAQGRRRTLARHVTRFAAAPVTGGYRLEIELRRPLFRSRRVALRRAVFVGARR